MERYKKRTIALCLASLLTVVGAFGTDNYDNTLMGLKINTGSGGYVNLTAFTQKPYGIPIKTKKIDDNTFVITLTNTNSNASAPNIDNYENIESIEISTYPYTTESDGYTRIIVKTSGNPMFSASHALFIPDNLHSAEPEQHESEDTNESQNTSYNSATQNTQDITPNISEQNHNVETNNKTDDNRNVFTLTNNHQYSGGSNEYMVVLLCASIIFLIIGIILIFSRDKMTAIVGDHNDFDVDNNKNKKQSKTQKLKSAINKLDKTYSNKKTASAFNYAESDEYNQHKENDFYTDKTEDENLQPEVVVDLDTLFQESQKAASENTVENNSNNDEYDDLADLMSDFVLNQTPEEVQEEIKEEEAFDKELYNEIINNKNLKFSDSDIQKINYLMQIEVSSETIDDLEKYLSTPIKKPVTQEQVLADLLATYSIRQNLNFTTEDVNAIKKLMNVELSPDFTKDFSTNPSRTKLIEKEIVENIGKKPHRTSEVLTLNVKDMLPDLSKELIKQGGKAIKTEAKPMVVYYSEGYEYKKLEVSDDFKSIDTNTTQNEYKPSYQAPIVESGYEYSTLTIKDELPNLDDVKANPEKYQKKAIKPKADELALLKSIANVTFKPFYEETENDLKPFDNDKPETITEPQNDSPVQTPKTEIKNNNAEKLLKLIEAQKNERAIKKQSAEDSDAFKKELESTAVKKKEQPKAKNTQTVTYNFEGKDVELLSTVKCTKNSSCKMVHADNKYVIIGNINEKEIVLKEYDSLKSSEMFIRPNSKIDKSTFLVKIGLKKFIIRITEDNMEFIMDLC